MGDQPLALKLADALQRRVVPMWIHAPGQTPQQSGYKPDLQCVAAAAELRRQHAEIERLQDMLYEQLGELTALQAEKQMRTRIEQLKEQPK